MASSCCRSRKKSPARSAWAGLSEVLLLVGFVVLLFVFSLGFLIERILKIFDDEGPAVLR
jgi:hypothetical protein